MSSKDDSKQTEHENDTDVHVYAELDWIELVV